MNWAEKIAKGMLLIMKGCNESEYWHNCKKCPFNDFCSSIYKDKEHHFTTPDSWKNEGLILEVDDDV